MNMAARLMLKVSGLLGAVLLLGSPALGADMNDYCVTPSFLAPDMKSNLLLMLDNSASMYDLAFIDEGKKNADGTFARQPYYCYDQSYKSKFCSNATTTSCSTDANCTSPGKCIKYSGYFDSDTYYQYNMASNLFETLGSFPGSCSKYVANTLCIDLDTSTPKKVTRFAAKGSYLNWLTTSKFDVQKQVLTGGKYDGANLVGETRGCVGRGFIKEAITADFVNYNSPETNNTNTGLGITFAIKGPNDAVNPTAASPGGQSYIEIYAGADYNQALCQTAITIASTPTSGQVEIRNAITACLTSLVGADLSLETKEKVVFNQTVQECWQYNKSTAVPKTVGNDAVSTVKTKCADVYDEAGVGGPAGLTAGHPATICNSTYAGACWDADDGDFGGCNGSATNCGDTCIKERHNAYCGSFTALQVTDPTDSPSDTSSFENIPAILSDIGVQAQLDKPLLTSAGASRLTVKIASPAPTGLLQEYSNRIRMGAMSFSNWGSASETGNLGTPKVCSNDPTRTCTVDTDCVAPGTCSVLTVAGVSNFDGAKILDNGYIGKGFCSATTTTPCATAAHCPADEECIAASVGTHTTAGLVKSIDDIRAATWTPLAEAFSSAIGYFAKSTADTDGKTSRTTGLRVNAGDYDANFNPSEYVCQKNNILLITDGMSTADRNPNVNTLVGYYNDGDGRTTTSATAATTCPKYSGSKNLDDLAWLAKNRNIKTFSTSLTSAAPASLQASEFIKTYAVFTGATNGEADECNPVTLLDQTAANGGTTAAKKTDGNPAKLKEDLKEIFQEISGGTASGTAASILSNSEGSGANILQAVFYPKKNFGATPITWIGELQNLWYYIDPFISKSTVREDTGYVSGTHYLNLKSDYALDFFFDSSDPSSTTYNQTMVRRNKDTDGNGTGDLYIDTISPDSVQSIWRAGKTLWETPYGSRTLYTPCLTGGTCVANTSATADASKGLMAFSSVNVDVLRPLLQAAASPSPEAGNLINYVKGLDDAALPYRGRTVTIDSTTNVWKLGDIISSTPRLQSSVKANSYDVSAPVGYGDNSYLAYTKQDSYKNRGMVYVGANDGMLHAFKLGKLEVTATGDQKASMSGTGLGEEQWAFIPKNSLPYLRYLTCKAGSGDAFCANQDYNHLYFVDGSTSVIDASIGGCATSYDLCDKDTVAGSNWRTVLLSGMGLGGASKDATDVCVEGVTGSCVKTPIAGTGLSSYFALDVTEQHFDADGALVGKPKMMWEFAVDGMGYATTGGVAVRVGNDKNKNGKWFAVFGSGPTGPIDQDKHQFLGKSTQPLKIFIVELTATPPFVLGTNYWVISTLADGTTLNDAFVSSVSNSTTDADRWLPSRPGNYQDDALYFGYVQASSTPIISTTKWRNGGVLRLMTKEDPNPANWKLSKVIDGIGPVTTSIARLQDRKNHNLWLFFGDGRYYYAGENMTTGRRLYGLKEPCYTSSDALDPNCTTKKVLTDLTDQTNIASASTTISNSGWRIDLAARDFVNNLGAERVITDPVAMNNGAVFFTTFMPTADACKFGGNSYLWATRYDTGLVAPSSALQGKALLQVSTGSFEEIDLGTAFTAQGGRKTAMALTGKPPGDPPPIVSNSTLKPVKRIIQIQEH